MCLFTPNRKTNIKDRILHVGISKIQGIYGGDVRTSFLRIRLCAVSGLTSWFDALDGHVHYVSDCALDYIKPVTDSGPPPFLLGADWLVRWQGSGADVPFQGIQMLFEAAGKQHLLKHLKLSFKNRFI